MLLTINKSAWNSKQTQIEVMAYWFLFLETELNCETVGVEGFSIQKLLEGFPSSA